MGFGGAAIFSSGLEKIQLSLAAATRAKTFVLFIFEEAFWLRTILGKIFVISQFLGLLLHFQRLISAFY